MALLESWQKIAYNEKTNKQELQRFWQRYFLVEKSIQRIVRQEITKDEALEKFKDDLGNIEYDNNIAKVSIVGVGMKSHSGVASTAFKALAQDDINIMMISTSEIKISMIINAQFAELAVCKLHSVYELDK